MKKSAIGIAFAITFLLAFIRQLGAEEAWPQFRGPTGQGISSARYLPVKWSAKSNVVWKTPLSGKGWSSPVLRDGRLYLTSAVDGKESRPVSLRVQCVNAANGILVWETEVFRPSSEEARALHQKNSLASATPIVSGNQLFVHFGHMGTAALDLTGKVVWRQASLKYSPVHGSGGSPTLVGDLLVFSCDGATDPFVVALDAATGAVRWRTPRNTPATKNFSFSTPLEIEVHGARQIISAGSGLVGAYDTESGQEIWRVLYGEGYSIVPRPVYAAGLLFVCSGYEGPVLLAINPDGARGNVTESHVAWRFRKGVPHTSSLLAVGDELYFVSDNGIAKCLDARTGKVHWDERLGDEFSASPIYAAGRVYFQSEAGVGIVVKAGKTFELLSRNDLEERTLASYAVIDHAHETAQWDKTSRTKWGKEFLVVKIRSKADSSLQPAYFLPAQSKVPRPLIVSLHTWSGDYSQDDPLAEMARKNQWNYIHPDFRGPNWTPDACLSKKALTDIDDAIQYAKDNGPVDTNNIFVVGVSGGGYAALGSYLKTSHQVKAFLSWAPISDLSAWFHQSKSRDLKYAQDILQCTSGGTALDQNNANERSPMFWTMPAKPKGRLEIYAGINDGYTGSVPISHSIQFFNRTVQHYGYAGSKVGQTDFLRLLTRGIERKDHPSTIGNREVVYRRDTKPVSLVIFDGSHEMLTEYCFDRIKQIAEHGD